MADDDRLTIIIATPNAVMAVRLVTGPVDHGWGVVIFKCRTIFSIRLLSIIGNAASRRRL
ncbi:hypothetical protein [Bradyrhizobium sp.]|uniref:hypothetical protein n=1 Tax=Bradyrhizobium sp. TaxID=376 RepID=UPI003D150035